MLAAGAAFADDLNCNGIEAAAEPLVDLADPVCAANIDPTTGAPYPSAEWYHDYFTYGCNLLLDKRFDIDDDGFGFGLVSFPGVEVRLQCDNCPSTNNPGQADANGDGIGDVCVDELYLDWPTPGVTGVPNEIIVLEATPGASVIVGASTALGTWPVAACGLDLGLDAPLRFDADAATGAGVAHPTRNVPNALAGQVVYFQAYEASTCRVSNIVPWSF